MYQCFFPIIKIEISLNRYKLFPKCKLYKKKTYFSDKFMNLIFELIFL